MDTDVLSAFQPDSWRKIVLENALDAVVGVNENNEVVDWNLHAESLFGWSKKEAIGRDMAELIIPEKLRSFHHRGLQKFLATGEEKILNRRIEITAQHRDGREFPVELTVIPIKLDAGYLFYSFLRDNSERKHRELEKARALAAAEASTRRLTASYEVMRGLAQAENFDNLGPNILQAIGVSLEWDVGIFWIVDEKDAVLRAAHHWKDDQIDAWPFLELSRQTTFGKGRGLPGRIWETGQPAWIDDVVEDSNFPRAPIAASDNLHGGFGFPIFRGKKIFGILEFFSRKIQPSDPEILQSLSTLAGQIEQVLHRLQVEAELKNLADENARLLQEAQVQTEKLADAIRSRDEFLSIASHELKTPITSLKLHAQLTTRLISKRDPTAFSATRLTQVFSNWGRQVDRLAHLVEDMLDITRISRGKLIGHMDVIDFQTVVREAIAPFVQMQSEGQPLPTLELDDSTLDVRADRFRLEQVVTNLLTNAVKYGNNQPIHVRLAREGQHALLEVIDEGIGIDPKNLQRIFLRFERAVSFENTTGLGLGLYIAKQILDLHGGTIEVASPGVGHGSAFRVRLPLVIGTDT